MNEQNSAPITIRNVHPLSDQERSVRLFNEQMDQNYKSFGKYLPEWLWNFMVKVDPTNPNHSKLYKILNGQEDLIPSHTVLGKLLRGDPSAFAEWFDVFSGKNLEYQRSLEERNYLENYNSESAQVARMLAAGLNPYLNGVQSSNQSAGSIPSAPGAGFADQLFGNLGSTIFNGLSSLLSGEIPERYSNLRRMKEELQGTKLDNLEKASKLGLDSSRIKKELRKMDLDYDVEREEQSRNKERFAEWRKQTLRDAEAHNKHMVAMDDQHNLMLHNSSRWSTEDAILAAQLQAMNDAHDKNEFERLYMWNLERSYLIAQTNSIINDDKFKWSSLHFQKDQFERNKFEHDRQFGLQSRSADDRHNIEVLQEQLLKGQISAQEYEAELRKHGLTLNSPYMAKHDVGLVDNVGNGLNSFLYGAFDVLPSIVRALK